MHILPATVLGVTVWIGTLAAAPSVGIVLAGPLIVSGIEPAFAPWKGTA